MNPVDVKTTEDALILRWLQHAVVSDNSRRILRGIHLGLGIAESSDGLRLHQTHSVPEPVANLNPGVWLLNDGKKLKKSPGFYHAVQQQNIREYPNTDGFYPSKEPLAVIVIDKEYLQQALDMPARNNAVVIEIYSPSIPVKIYDIEEKHSALVMPLFYQDSLPKHTLIAIEKAELAAEEKTVDELFEDVRAFEKEYEEQDV